VVHGATEPLTRAEDLRSRAVALNNVGRAAEARELLQSTLDQLATAPPDAHDRLEWDRLRCNTIITLALTEFLLGGLRGARRELGRAQRLAEQLGDADLLARVEYQHANILGRHGDLASAWPHLQRALARPQAFTAVEMCSVHLSNGMLALSLSKPRDALTSFSQARHRAHEQGLGMLERMAAHNEGYATYLLGDLPAALSRMAAAEQLSVDAWFGTEALDRAQVLLEAGLLEDAVDQLRRASARLGDDEPALRAEAELELARALRLLGQPEGASAAAVAARAGYEELGSAGWAARARLVATMLDLDGLRRAASAQGTRSGRAHGTRRAASHAVSEATQVADVATSLGDPALARSARVVLADGLLQRGDADAAAELLGTVRASEVTSLAAQLDTVAVAADVHVARGELTRARSELTRAARRLASSSVGSASLDLRTARAVHGTRLARIDLDLAASRGGLAVLESLERWRSATDRMPSIGRPDDDRLAELTEQLRAVGAALRGDDVPNPAELRRRAASLEREIRSRDWALSNSRDGSNRTVEVRVREARDELERADRDLVWFFARGGRLHGVGFSGRRAQVRELGPLEVASELAHRIRVDLRTAATTSLGPFTDAVWGSLRAAARELDDILLRPWRTGRRGLVIVTTPELSALPWALLPSAAGRPLTIARSLTSFARRERAANSSHDPGQASVYVAVGPGLDRASDEAKAVADLWPRSEVVDPSTASGLVAALGASAVVHVAAHGTHHVQSPLFSSVSLHDGPVFAHELQSGGVASDHVVLSACEVGTATFRPGDEQLGLAAALLSLGARSAVASVAPVPDETAADVMVRHHARLAEGRPSDESLALAIEESDPLAVAFLNLGGRYTAGEPAGR
jgi:tetratricopeptide (TPR) repeat protein